MNQDIAMKIATITAISCSVIIVASIIYAMIMKQRTKNRGMTVKGVSRNRRNHSYFLYQIYVKTPWLSTYFEKMKRRVEAIYPADRISVNIKVTRDFSKALFTSLAIGLLILIVGWGDMFFIGTGLVVTYVTFTQMINGQISSMEDKLDGQFANFLTDVRHYYHDTNDVADSVYMTLNDIPYELGLHINRIYQILSGTHTEEDVEKYTDIAPNRFLMMFAAIAATIKEYGDKRLEDGQWLFLKNLNHLKDELNIEILKKKQLTYLFRGLKGICLTPVFLMKLIEKWAISNMPEMAEFYTNGSGTIVMAICFAVTIFCYQMVCNLRDGKVDAMKENTLLTKLSGMPVIRRLLTAEVNRNYSKSLRRGDELKIVGETIGPREFLLKRVLYGIGIAIAFNVVIIFSQAQQRSSLLHDFSESYENTLVPNADYRNSMRVISSKYIGIAKEQNLTEKDRDLLANSIAANEKIKKTYAEVIADEIVKRIGSFREIYYKYYMFILTVLFFFVGFSIPFLLLKYQLSILKMDMEDEVAQFQTLALILVNVDGMTIDTLLIWMERFSFAFRTSISECITNLEFSVQKSLEKMKNSEPFPPFKRFCDNLLSIDNVGIVSAFDEIESEREFYKKKREQDNEMIANKKAGRAKLICYVPLISVLGLYMILPFLQMAMSMMSVMNDAIKSL